MITHKTYGTASLYGFSELDTMLKRSNNGSAAISLGNGNYADMAALSQDIESVNTDLLHVLSKISLLETSRNQEIGFLREENYQLQQRLDKLEMMIGDN